MLHVTQVWKRITLKAQYILGGTWDQFRPQFCGCSCGRGLRGEVIHHKDGVIQNTKITKYTEIEKEIQSYDLGFIIPSNIDPC